MRLRRAVFYRVKEMDVKKWTTKPSFAIERVEIVARSHDKEWALQIATSLNETEGNV